MDACSYMIVRTAWKYIKWIRRLISTDPTRYALESNQKPFKMPIENLRYFIAKAKERPNISLVERCALELMADSKWECGFTTEDRVAVAFVMTK